MSQRYVFDTEPLVAHFYDEPRAGVVAVRGCAASGWRSSVDEGRTNIVSEGFAVLCGGVAENASSRVP